MNTHTTRGWHRVKAYHLSLTAPADLRAWAERAEVPHSTVRTLLDAEKGPRADTLAALEAAIPEDFVEPEAAQ
jgi:hypothetical protein